MGQLRQGHPVQGTEGGLDEAVDDVGRRALPVPERVPHVLRRHRAVIAGELVIGDQHPVHPAQGRGQVQLAGHVEDLGFHPGQHLDSRRGPELAHRGHELRHPG